MLALAPTLNPVGAIERLFLLLGCTAKYPSSLDFISSARAGVVSDPVRGLMPESDHKRASFYPSSRYLVSASTTANEQFVFM